MEPLPPLSILILLLSRPPYMTTIINTSTLSGLCGISIDCINPQNYLWYLSLWVCLFGLSLSHSLFSPWFWMMIFDLFHWCHIVKWSCETKCPMQDSSARSVWLQFLIPGTFLKFSCFLHWLTTVRCEILLGNAWCCSNKSTRNYIYPFQLCVYCCSILRAVWMISVSFAC